ncbi:hypothetical protein HMPREF9220_1340 [Dialister micraerophilus UPII 345-E]|uniref:Uncharacterized protein n=1 Tax=Dialister micraerophilus UPII 345-E TaxID=910314 RepID=E4L748_9FIRM|nr:hypothetical protein HMPREF9220_1340 [Dialister micraerophilus UPII 345-E]
MIVGMHYKFGLNLSGCFFVAEILMNAGVLTGAFTCVFIKKNKPFPCFGNFCGKGKINCRVIYKRIILHNNLILLVVKHCVESTWSGDLPDSVLFILQK